MIPPRCGIKARHVRSSHTSHPTRHPTSPPRPSHRTAEISANADQSAAISERLRAAGAQRRTDSDGKLVASEQVPKFATGGRIVSQSLARPRTFRVHSIDSLGAHLHRRLQRNINRAQPARVARHTVGAFKMFSERDTRSCPGNAFDRLIFPHRFMTIGK